MTSIENIIFQNLVLKKHEDACLQVILIFHYLQNKRICRLLRVLSFSKFVTPFFLFLFSFLSAFEFLLRLLFLLFFHGYFGRTIKMKIFSPCHERAANGDRRLFKALRKQVSKDVRMRDASDMHVAIMRPSVTKLKVAKEERGRNVRWCKNRSFLCGQPCCLIIHDYPLFRALFRLMLSHVENTCGIWCSVDMSLWDALRIDPSDRRRVWWLKSDLEFLFNSKSR